MANLYTVEFFAVYRGITLSQDDNKYFFSLFFNDDDSIKDDRIYLEKKLYNDLSTIKLGMRVWPVILRASFYLGNKVNHTFRRSLKRESFKIFRAAYNKLSVITGKAEYLIKPNSSDRYILVKIYPKTKLRLISGNSTRLITYDDLK